MAWYLLHVPHDFAEYVICDDLLHLRIPDHGKGFRALMNAHMPDWKDREQRLAAWTLRHMTTDANRAGRVGSDAPRPARQHL